MGDKNLTRCIREVEEASLVVNVDCPECGGDGELKCDECLDFDCYTEGCDKCDDSQIVDCYFCGGKGSVKAISNALIRDE